MRNQKRYPGQFYDELSPAGQRVFMVVMCLYLGAAAIGLLISLFV